MSGRLTLLHTKSWNVWSGANRERVARDEREAEAAEQAAAATERARVREVSLRALRGEGFCDEEFDEEGKAEVVGVEVGAKRSRADAAHASQEISTFGHEKKALAACWWQGSRQPDLVTDEDKRRRDDARKAREDPLRVLAEVDAESEAGGGPSSAVVAGTAAVGQSASKDSDRHRGKDRDKKKKEKEKEKKGKKDKDRDRDRDKKSKKERKHKH